MFAKLLGANQQTFERIKLRVSLHFVVGLGPGMLDIAEFPQVIVSILRDAGRGQAGEKQGSQQ
ncbi:hypothetical protein [endosymbiont of unidentified scaly snail isolate Monju]|uniref:hypothetical protein n=1 Tax=endosymbiont of unidentified scaly snail isolate Monju TaxID=1248727 RepID=UPI001E6472A6|nr:hypothetical protein [endosymbiont of unidentified scaly snail isolate Monju]